MLVLTLCILVSVSIVTLSYFLFRSATILVHEYHRVKHITNKAITELHSLNEKLASDEFKKLTDIAGVIFPSCGSGSGTGEEDGQTTTGTGCEDDDDDELKTCNDGCIPNADEGDEDVVGDISENNADANTTTPGDATNANATDDSTTGDAAAADNTDNNNTATGDDTVIVQPPDNTDTSNV
jgi:hypothetical protein